MSTVSHPPSDALVRAPRTSARLLVTEMWASLAIGAMWLAVAIAAVWGPDFVSTSGSGATTTTIPSAIGVALFASIGTWAVAKYVFGRSREDQR